MFLLRVWKDDSLIHSFVRSFMVSQRREGRRGKREEGREKREERREKREERREKREERREKREEGREKREERREKREERREKKDFDVVVVEVEKRIAGEFEDSFLMAAAFVDFGDAIFLGQFGDGSILEADAEDVFDDLVSVLSGENFVTTKVGVALRPPLHSKERLLRVFVPVELHVDLFPSPPFVERHECETKDEDEEW